ncbi:penicillin-binding protein [Mesoterricola silvestris]|uniref:Penicillin-binding protein n=1 Tax=Mesoterricola silvestris TaxID=2927979 RepID=A0AA48GY82_9BACT|nr:penicillin-binding protein [Mesoterricola silvestris]
MWVLMITLRLLWLQGVQHTYYRLRAERQHTTVVPIAPIRGELRDRRGGSLAISLKVDSLFANPPSFYPDFRAGKGDTERNWGEPDRQSAQKVAAQLAPILEMSRASILERLLRKKPFVWLERQLPASKVAAIKALKIDGVDFLPESKRHYPRGSLACQIVGFINIDGQGQLGIERTFDEQLAGKPGELIAPRDAKGRLLIMQENYAKVPVNGSTLQLTIDSTIQHIVEEALEEGVRRSHPATAYAVVVDPQTGEILAMAGTPTFDPNHIMPKRFLNRSESEWTAAEKEDYKREMERQKAARKVHPVEDSYEPGSTMKIFTAAMALEEHKVHLGEMIACEAGRWKYADKVVTDTHSHGTIPFEAVLWQSSNIGAAKIGLRLDPAVHFQYLRKFGFGETTGLNFPGETAGRLQAPDRWSRTTQLTMSYGYGLSASPLQVLMAGCVLANGGKLMQPYIIQKIFNDQGNLLQEFKPKVKEQVISEETSAMMREALKGVITNGTGKMAKLDGNIEAFGKTGTSRKLVNGQYEMRRHYASFLGFFPADKPQYGMLFMLDDPAGDATGGDVAAPLFKKIGDAIMRYRLSLPDSGQEADLKLGLRDWPVSENDEAVVHVEIGKVPDLKGLTLKAAILRVVMAGGVPKLDGLGDGGGRAFRVDGQDPAPGSALEPNGAVKIKLRAP